MFSLRPPDLLRREPLFEGTNVCNSQENGVRTRCAATVNHYAIANLLRRAKLLRRIIFSTAGSFGRGCCPGVRKTAHEAADCNANQHCGLNGLFPLLDGPFSDLNGAFPRFRRKGPCCLLKIRRKTTHEEKGH